MKETREENTEENNVATSRKTRGSFSTSICLGFYVLYKKYFELCVSTLTAY